MPKKVIAYLLACALLLSNSTAVFAANTSEYDTVGEVTMTEETTTNDTDTEDESAEDKVTVKIENPENGNVTFLNDETEIAEENAVNTDPLQREYAVGDTCRFSIIPDEGYSIDEVKLSWESDESFLSEIFSSGNGDNESSSIVATNDEDNTWSFTVSEDRPINICVTFCQDNSLNQDEDTQIADTPVVDEIPTTDNEELSTNEDSNAESYIANGIDEDSANSDIAEDNEIYIEKSDDLVPITNSDSDGLFANSFYSTFSARSTNYYDVFFWLCNNANNDGKGDLWFSGTYAEGVYNLPYVPTRTGYTFLGIVDSFLHEYPDGSHGGAYYWNSQGVALHEINYLCNGNVFCLWSANNYTVYFNANGGYCPYNAVTTTYDSSNYYAVGVPSKSGYTFDGWYTSATGGTKVYDANGICTNEGTFWSGNVWKYAGDTTLYAHYTQNVHTLTINPNGGLYNNATGSAVCYTVFDSQSYNSIGIPTRTGYNFTGWYVADGTPVWDSNGYAIQYQKNTTYWKNGYDWNAAWMGGCYRDWEHMLWNYDGDLTVYAHWAPYTHTVAFNANGGSGAPGNQTKTYGSTIWLSSTKPVRTGYTFTGWNTDIKGKGTPYNAGSEYGFDQNGGTATLYAQWKANTYTLTYNGNGGTTPGAKKASYDSKWGSLADSSRTGYIFSGWYDSPSGGAQITSDTVCAGNKTVYAHWKPITYTVFYDGNGSTNGATGDSSHAFDTASELTGNGFARAGYTFAGWNTKADGSGTAYNDKDSIINLTDVDGQTITLYAQWRLKPVTVSAPRSLILNQDGNGSFVIKADNETGTVTVNADPTINLTQKGKDQVITGTVSLDQNTLTRDRHEIKGSINTESLSAGSWNGVFNLNITFRL